MDQTLAYEIGAVFLLAAFLMMGSSSRFLPARFRLGPGTLAILGIAVALFGVVHFWPEIYPEFIAAAPDTGAASAPAAASIGVTAAIPVKSTKSAHAQPIAEARWKSIVVEATAPAATVEASVPAPAAVADSTPDPTASGPCEKSPYQSKFKRALKSAGCAIHILPRK